MFLFKKMSYVDNWKELIRNWDEIVKNDRDSIIRTFRIGIPDKYRKLIWPLLVDFRAVKRSANFEYNALLVESSSENIIDCDVPRTFPIELRDRQKKMESLRNVLVAYSNADKEIGYIQGMNFIAGMFVKYVDEETAFWCFYSVMKRSHRRMYVDKFIHLRELAAVVDRAILDKLPEVHEKFVEFQITPLLYTPVWFNSCFITAELDERMTLFIFDQFLAFGEPVLLSFGLTVISLHKQLLLSSDYSSFLSALTCPGRSEIMHNRQRVNMEWVNLWVTNKEFHQYKKIYINNPDLIAKLE